MKTRQYTDIFYKMPCIFAIDMEGFECNETSVTVRAIVRGEIINLVLSKPRFQTIQQWYDNAFMNRAKGAFVYVKTYMTSPDGMTCDSHKDYFRHFEQMIPSTEKKYNEYLERVDIKAGHKYQSLEQQLIKTLLEMDSLQTTPVLNEYSLYNLDDIDIVKSDGIVRITIGMRCNDNQEG